MPSPTLTTKAEPSARAAGADRQAWQRGPVSPEISLNDLHIWRVSLDAPWSWSFDEALSLDGAAAPTESGYLLTFAVPAPELGHLTRQTGIDLDLVVNEMRSDRIRRAGQLVWGGGGGWIYLRGDRHDPDRFGRLSLLS